MISLQLNRDGACFLAPKTELARLRRHFDKNHFIKLKQFLAPELLNEVRKEIRESEFFKKVHKDIAIELCAKEGAALRILKFVSEDPQLFQWVREMTGCAAIGCFTGRIYRMTNDKAHHDDWHNDMTEHRMIAMSVNVGEKPYRGGHLVLRHRGKPETERVVPNTRPGDAVLFRLSYDLEHRVLDVESDEPKTAYAGWFRSRPNFFEQVKKLRKRRKTKKTASR